MGSVAVAKCQHGLSDLHKVIWCSDIDTHLLSPDAGNFLPHQTEILLIEKALVCLSIYPSKHECTHLLICSAFIECLLCALGRQCEDGFFKFTVWWNLVETGYKSRAVWWVLDLKRPETSQRRRQTLGTRNRL